MEEFIERIKKERWKNERKVSIQKYKKYLEFVSEDAENEKITFETYYRYGKVKSKSFVN